MTVFDHRSMSGDFTWSPGHLVMSPCHLVTWSWGSPYNLPNRAPIMQEFWEIVVFPVRIR